MLLDTFLPTLDRLLAEHNTQRTAQPCRLRIAVHSGEVHYDRLGPFGETVDLACRLVDAPELKFYLTRTPEVTVLAVSDTIYRSIIRHRYAGIDTVNFEAYAKLFLLLIGGLLL